MQKQLEHNQVDFRKRTFPLVLVLDDVTDPKNVGSVFRLADALGIEALFLCGDTPRPPHKTIRKTSRNTERFVQHHYFEHSTQCIGQLKQDGYVPVVLEITSGSLAICEFNFSSLSKIALIAGNEENGVGETVLGQINHAVHIPMMGQNSSMNVAVAAAIAAHEIIRQVSSLADYS